MPDTNKLTKTKETAKRLKPYRDPAFGGAPAEPTEPESPEAETSEPEQEPEG